MIFFYKSIVNIKGKCVIVPVRSNFHRSTLEVLESNS